MTREAEVVVVGAGIMGLATARALARAGRNVVVLEQFALGHDRGSSHGTSRIFRLSYPDATWVRLAQEALPLWRELEAEGGEELLQLHGSIDVGEWRAHRNALAQCGVEFEVLDRGEGLRRFGLRLEPGEQALFQREGGIALADRAAGALAGSAREHGAALHEQVRVTDVREADASVEVELEGETISAEVAIVTAGAWAPRLVDLDARITRETTAYFASDGPLPSLIDDTLEAQAHGYGLAAPGVGMKAGLHKSGPTTDPDDVGVADEATALATGEWLAGRLASVSPDPIAVETCLYTRLEGDRFTLERRGRVVVGSPCSGHGFKFAPLIGSRLAALASEVLTERGHAPVA